MIRERYAPEYALYVDRRLGGEPRYSLGRPKDASVRIPDDLLTCPIFLGGKDSTGRLHYRATAFVIGAPTTHTELGGMCLVTARHNVLRALAEYRNVWMRLNTKDGGAKDFEIAAPWTYPDDPASDVAAVPFWPPSDWEGIPIPTRWFLTDEIIETRGVGVGEELTIVGLFSHHRGKKRNLPIVRSGNVASMPQEPLVDDESGEEYEAYLAEVRSIGGLSGSPVFVALNPVTRLNDPDFEDVGGQPFYLLGLVRGHWGNPYAEQDFRGTEIDYLNAGIAIVTPIAEVLPLLESEEFVRHRKEVDAKMREALAARQVKDWAAEDSESEFERFEDLSRKLIAVPKKELDEKRKEES